MIWKVILGSQMYGMEGRRHPARMGPHRRDSYTGFVCQAGAEQAPQPQVSGSADGLVLC